MAFDFGPYVAFGLGILLGRLIRWRTPWIDRATMASVFALVFFLGATLAQTPGLDLTRDVPLSLGFAGLILGLTIGISLLLPHRIPESGGPEAHASGGRALVGVEILAVLVAGFFVGKSVGLPANSLLTASLYVLLALIGFDLHLSRAAWREIPSPLLAAIAGALLAGVLFSILSGASLRLSLATAFGFGWYSLTGSVVLTGLGATAGLLAFLTNFLHENLTMATAAWLAPRVHPEGLIAMGAATTMDTTLYFVTRFGGRQAGSAALASGLVLTILAGLLVPLIVWIP
jgi:uncharacterized membrane protein YbjE (DUF340 family)